MTWMTVGEAAPTYLPKKHTQNLFWATVGPSSTQQLKWPDLISCGIGAQRTVSKPHTLTPGIQLIEVLSVF
jgi:hypothetical protein